MFKTKLALVAGLGLLMALPAAEAFSQPISDEDEWPPHATDPTGEPQPPSREISEADLAAGWAQVEDKPSSRDEPKAVGVCYQNYKYKVCWGRVKMSPSSEAKQRGINIKFHGGGFFGTPTITDGFSIKNKGVADHFVVFTTNYTKYGASEQCVSDYEVVSHNVSDHPAGDDVFINFFAIGLRHYPGWCN